MSRFAPVVLILGCSLAVTAGGAASRPTRVHVCDFEQLAFALTQPSPPTQSQAVGLAVYNTAHECRLALPVSLTVAHRSGRPLRVTPHASRLTLLDRTFGRRAWAGVTWTTHNYCGRERSDKPILYIVRVGPIQVRGTDGAPPCHARTTPVSVVVLFACPRARGPAIDAILPRPLPLCPR